MTERWTPTAPDHIVYIATIEDPPVDEQWENAVWEGNRTADLVLGGAKK